MVAGVISPVRSITLASAVGPSSHGVEKTKWSLADTAAKLPSSGVNRRAAAKLSSVSELHQRQVDPKVHGAIVSESFAAAQPPRLLLLSRESESAGGLHAKAPVGSCPGRLATAPWATVICLSRLSCVDEKSRHRRNSISRSLRGATPFDSPHGRSWFRTSDLALRERSRS